MSSSSLESPESFLMSGLQILIFEEKGPFGAKEKCILIHFDNAFLCYAYERESEDFSISL